MVDILGLVLIVVILTALGLLGLGWFLDQRHRTVVPPGGHSRKNER